MSTSGQFENMICEAIETLVDRAVEKANYDKTIQASIVEQVDATIGKYKVKYQDSTFFAYAADVSANYSKGTNVYILIPSNDMEKDKTIIGAVEKLGTDYIPTVPEKNKYDEIGSNFIEIPHDEIGVCSYYKTEGFSFLDPTVLNPKSEEEKDYFLIYDYKRTTNYISLIAAEQIEKYMRDSSYLICGATFKTNLEPRQIQDTSGTYGIEFELTFKSGEDIVDKVYRIDNNDMEGYPYHYEKGSAQRVYFPIDGKNFVRIKRIQLFCTKFPNIDNTRTKDDILVSNLLLQGANKISEEDLNGCYLTLTTPQGEFLSKNEKPEISLVANLRVKGQNVGSDQNVSYYWFRENPKITRESDLFHLYGGLGWECLNKQTLSEPIETIDENGNKKQVYITDFTPMGNTFSIKWKDIKSKYAKYKCVAVYNGNSFSAEKVIQNNDFDYILELVTDSGKTSFNGFGKPIITCNIYNKQGELLTSLTDFTFSWAQVNSNGQFTSLSEKGNKIEVNMNQILTFATYKCAVYIEENKDDFKYVGSSSITLRNEEAQELDLYSLVINNGSKVFKYNEAGVSPASSRLDDPMIIPELSFTLYDPEGKKVEATSIDSNVWYFPTENTMLELNYKGEPPVEDKYFVITNPEDGKISYSIADLYDPAKTNNTIRLSVKIGDTTYTETTTFLFVREGDSGTNGTDYVLRILPNVSETNEGDPLIPILTKSRADEGYFWNYTLKADQEALKLQIWKSETLIYEGTDSGDIALMDKKVEGESAVPNATLNWVNLIHKYSSTFQDISYINLNESSEKKALFTGNFSDEADPANIIQARVSCDGAFFSATLPIITAEVPSKDYRIKLKDGSGFTSVVYSADGMFPQYNKNTPFEISIEKKNAVSGKWEEQKLDNSEKFKYNWSIRGKVNGKDVSSDYLKNSLKITKTDNQYWTVPVERCSAECLSVAVYCEILNEDDSVFGWIHIPIHFMLNRYGQAALNGWDGNSVDINEEGGYILSPQVGAGRKEIDNSFTGIFMGEVKEYKDNSEISHNGILGYHHGVKSLFINAEDGSAIFGKITRKSENDDYEGGQIILDPSNKDAVLYSANFFAPSAYKKDGKANISGERTGKGLLINLTKPEIVYGNGNFSVNEKGFITAKGGGEIAGWLINDFSLFNKGQKIEGEEEIIVKENLTGMSSYPLNPETDKNLPSKGRFEKIIIPFYNKDTEEILFEQKIKAIAFWAGEKKFFVSHDGYLKIDEANIGSGNNPIYIGKSITKELQEDGSTKEIAYSALFSLKHSNFIVPGEGFYFGENGLSFGAWKGTLTNGFVDAVTEVPSEVIKPNPEDEDYEKKLRDFNYYRQYGLYKYLISGKVEVNSTGFSVDKDGTFFAKKGFIGINELNGWNFEYNKIWNGFKTSPTSIEDGFYIGTDGMGIGSAISKIIYQKDYISADIDDVNVDKDSLRGAYYHYARYPAFFIKGGVDTNDESLNEGFVGLSRGLIGGSWRVDHRGIQYVVYQKENKMPYEQFVRRYDEDGTEDNKNIENIPKDAYFSNYTLSENTWGARLNSLQLPENDSPSIYKWDKDIYDKATNYSGYTRYSHQRLIAGKYILEKLSNGRPNKRWCWMVLDDGTMYARRAVVSTAIKAEWHNTKGNYFGPEGIRIGKNFKVDSNGDIVNINLKNITTPPGSPGVGGVGKKVDNSQTEIFNDYSTNKVTYTFKGSGGRSHIEGANNTLATNAYCIHIEGFNNSVSGKNAQAVHVEGYSNKAINSQYSHITGMSNTLINANFSGILSGHSNSIENLDDGCGTILNGFNNHIYEDLNVILGGQGNTIYNGVQYGLIYGLGNSISSGVPASYIFGQDNSSQSKRTLIVGISNTVIESYEAFVVGNKNSLTGSTGSILCGQQNVVNFSAANSGYIIGGISNTISSHSMAAAGQAANGALILGISNVIQNSNASIINGIEQKINDSHVSLCLGYSNEINSCGYILMNGLSNKITSCSSGGLLVCGGSIYSESSWTSLLGWNLKSSGNKCSLVGGNNSAEEGAEHSFSFGYKTYIKYNENVAFGHNVYIQSYHSGAIGRNIKIKSNGASFAIGENLEVFKDNSIAFGSGALVLKETDEDIFIIGNGISGSKDFNLIDSQNNISDNWETPSSSLPKSNSMSITNRGSLKITQSLRTGRTGYAEMFNSNLVLYTGKDALGRFVAFNEAGLVEGAFAKNNIIGITTSCPAIGGGSFDEYHDLNYFTDEFGDYWNPTLEEKETEEYKDRFAKVQYNLTSFSCIEKRNSSKVLVALKGITVVRQDGTCLEENIGQYCKCNEDSVATLATERTKFQIVEIINSKFIKVLINDISEEDIDIPQEEIKYDSGHYNDNIEGASSEIREVTISFQTQFNEAPNLTATLTNGFGFIMIKNCTTTQATISILPYQGQDMSFDWIAIEGEDKEAKKFGTHYNLSDYEHINLVPYTHNELKEE